MNQHCMDSLYRFFSHFGLIVHLDSSRFLLQKRLIIHQFSCLSSPKQNFVMKCIHQHLLNVSCSLFGFGSVNVYWQLAFFLLTVVHHWMGSILIIYLKWKYLDMSMFCFHYSGLIDWNFSLELLPLFFLVISMWDKRLSFV